MRTYFFILLIFLLTAAGWTLSAFHAPPLTGRLVDQAGIFNTAQKTKINTWLAAFEQQTKGQMAVAILTPPENSSIEEIGIKLMDQWKIGYKGKDNGAILILIPAQRKNRLEIGYGWEGIVNDARAGDVLRAMQPFLRKNDYENAVRTAIGMMTDFIRNGGETEGTSAKQSPFSMWNLLIGAAVIIFIVFMLLKNLPKDTGPHEKINATDIAKIIFAMLLFLLPGGGRGRGGGNGGFGGGGGRGGGGGASGGW